LIEIKALKDRSIILAYRQTLANPAAIQFSRLRDVRVLRHIEQFCRLKAGRKAPSRK
jgi:hypothetical protein